MVKVVRFSILLKLYREEGNRIIDLGIQNAPRVVLLNFNFTWFVLEFQMLHGVQIWFLIYIYIIFFSAVSFSLLSKERVIFEQVFQIERRILRAAFEVQSSSSIAFLLKICICVTLVSGWCQQPISCAAGTQLENLIFEVINTEGEVDENIHNEDKGGQPHTLAVQSDSLQIDDSLRYSFSYGRCKVRSIPVPVTEGIFYFEVAHSFHPELHLSVEVF